MGASVSIDVMPERITKAMVNELFPLGYDERQFDDRAAKHEDGCISKAQFADLLSRTDVFITHDWGKELDMDNHARVARVNDGLKNLGLLTWFDSEKMKGNIKVRPFDPYPHAPSLFGSMLIPPPLSRTK
jgi:hypothetical protein